MPVLKYILVYNTLHTIHTGVFSFTMFTASTVFYNCSLNNYAGIFKIHWRNISEFFFFKRYQFFVRSFLDLVLVSIVITVVCVCRSLKESGEMWHDAYYK